jgi:cysteine desulfurase/selenocysteine lyase
LTETTYVSQYVVHCATNVVANLTAKRAAKYCKSCDEEFMIPLEPRETSIAPPPVLADYSNQYRQFFPITEKFVYLNHASVSPLSQPTRDRMTSLLGEMTVDLPRIFEKLERMIASVRLLAARLVNGEPEQIAFLRNTSEALSVIANGYPWKAGDNIVSTGAEFPANLYPWVRLESAYGVEIRYQRDPNGWVNVDELLSLVDERTRIVTVSWVEFATGQRVDIRRIGKFCRERGILFVIDAVQGLGALQLDVQRDFVDAFAAGAQKFLLGPKGVGLLYLSNRALERVRPTTIGWTAVTNYEDYLPHDLNFRKGAIRFEGGTLNVLGIAGLGEALELFLRAGPAQIEKYLLSLNSYLAELLIERGYHVVCPRNEEEASAILVCQSDRFSGEEICTRLGSQNIITSARLNRLRIAPHFYNTREDMDALIAALPV